MTLWRLDWRFGTAAVRASAGMLWECEFRLPSGRRFAPFARAPWAQDPYAALGQPAHMRHLGGEFACVPFGIGGAPTDLLPEWRSDSWARVNPVPHGYSSDLDWDLVRADSNEILLRLDYPSNDDIAFLTRRVAADPATSALDLELTVHARRPTRQPIGLHPILRLPMGVGQLKLEADFDFGMTYPAEVPPGVSRVARGSRFTHLQSIAGLAGATVDYSSLPKSEPTEEMLMLCNVRGPVVARYVEENALLRVIWDRSVLPSCLLWPSDRALSDPPWNRCFRGLGVEPIAAVFDASRDVALENNPLHAAGVVTAVAITPERPITVCYRLEAADA